MGATDGPIGCALNLSERARDIRCCEPLSVRRGVVQLEMRVGLDRICFAINVFVWVPL
jgi:hypothetical protein